MADFIKRSFGNNLTLARDAAARGPFAPEISETNDTSAFHDDTSYQIPRRPVPATRTPEDSSFDSTTRSDKAASKNRGFGPQYTQVGAYDNDYHGPPPNERASWFGRKVRDCWLKEIFSLLCSLGSLIAIVIVLAQHDKKPSHNLAAGVSLNTYLAVFATIAKAGLMYPVMSCIGQLKWIWFSKKDAPLADFAKFDDATRGPWDSLMLLGSLKFWYVFRLATVHPLQFEKELICYAGIPPVLVLLLPSCPLEFLRLLNRQLPILMNLFQVLQRHLLRRPVQTCKYSGQNFLSVQLVSAAITCFPTPKTAFYILCSRKA